MSIPSVVSATVRRRRHSLLLGSADYTGSTLTASVFALTANGSATTTLTATVERGGNLAGGEVVNYAVSRTFVSASNTVVLASPGAIDNDGVMPSTITITVLDTNNVPLPGIPAASVVVAVSGTGNTVTQPATATDANGQTTASFVSTVAATKVVSVTVCGLAITDTASVVVSGTPLWRGNEPVGLSSSDSTNFTNASDWDFYYVGSDGSASGYDATASSPPRSSPYVAHFQVPTGTVPGAFIGGAYPSLNPGNYTKVYTCAWVRISPNATMHPANWKFWYHYGIGYTGSIVFGFKPDGSITTGGIKVSTDTQGQTSPTTVSDSSSVITRGQWFLLETLVDVTGGLWRAWVDGVQVINVTGQTWTENIEEVHLDPYYGGNSPGHTVATDTYVDVDTAYIAWS